METEKIIENLKDRLEGETLDAFEICYIGHKHLSVEARDQSVESFVRSSEGGLAVRAVKDRRMGCASTTDLSSKACEDLLTKVMQAVKEVSPSEESVISSPSAAGSNLNSEGRMDSPLNEERGRAFDEISDSKKIHVALELERVAKTADKKITRVRAPLYEETTRHVVIVNSNGISQSAKRGMASCEVRAIAESSGVSESGWDMHFSPLFDNLQVEQTAKSAAARALSLLGAAPLKTGRYDVIFESRAAANLIRLMAPSFFAHNVQRKKSVLVGKKGDRLYHKTVDIIDDGLRPGGYGSFPFDDEGVPRRKNYLVKAGTVAGWLYDTARAVKDGCSSTGNCSRSSIHQLPSINVSNCYLAEGDSSPKVLLSKLDKGFLITDVMGLHTANFITGDFSLGAEGFRVESGLKGGPVRGVLVAGNIHDLFKRPAGIGVDLKFWGDYGSPSVLIPDVQISGGR